MATNGYNSITGASTVIYATIHDIFGNETESVRQTLQANLAKFAARTAEVSGGTMKASDLEHLFQAQFDLIFERNTPVAEVVAKPGGGNVIATEYWSLLPFARGNVHISSAKPLSMPTIDPNYFIFDYDLKIQIAIARFIRSVLASEPANSLVASESTPGFSTVPVNASDEEWTNWFFDGHCGFPPD